MYGQLDAVRTRREDLLGMLGGLVGIPINMRGMSGEGERVNMCQMTVSFVAMLLKIHNCGTVDVFHVRFFIATD